ncbi:LEAF RUST 10 DISEASE-RESISTANCEUS RECEPTOR-LIKE PROTEIN KINASE-like 1.2 [Spinacia oleracea]|uniref:non-specific serine/threonine protein kinase n=1 Tax=Spinacia oleracea TaxID=3562 RepID=A0A9R0JD92_SPIOL|nr:LEAF RUST 10 DISEASE-RESISTANCE LOCUS RECEPTOR-LIKE PROTEIN KINASE-like 1.2 [Spinacia oleracea]
MHLLNLIKSIFFIILYNNVDPSFSLQHYRGSQYEACIFNTSTTCGKSSFKISYPFWGNGRPEYCGHPGFNLSCHRSNLKIKIMSRMYNVLSINYNTSTLRIVSEGFSQGECPQPGHLLYNTTLDLDLFNYTSNVRNASLYYDCPELKHLGGAPFSFDCKGSYLNRLSFLVITDSWEHELGDICGIKLYVPVFRNAYEDLVFHPSSRIGDVLKRGFEVKWVIDQGQCQDCYISGGCCGYNMSLGQSICFCQSGSYPTVCPQLIAQTPSKGMNLEAKVGIGVGAAAGLLFIMITVFVFVRSKKDYHSSSPLPSQKIPPSLPTILEEKSSYFGAQLFSYMELQQATNGFDPCKELGKGGFGTVYHGILDDGREVAVKRLYEKQDKQVVQFMNELEILTRLDHKHLVKLYGCTIRSSPELVLVYEYVPNGTLADHLHGHKAKLRSLPWPIRLRIAIETASALVYLHSSDIIHRDVKTKNILLDINCSVKVADFGLSRLFPLDVSHVSTTPQGSPGYVDPEYQQCYQLTNKSDVYSFGVVLAEIISGKPAVDRNRNRQEINLSHLAINRILKRDWSGFIDPKLKVKKNCKVREQVIAVADLSFKCLQATSETRPCMEQVLQSLKNIQGEESVKDVVVYDVSNNATAVFNGSDYPISSLNGNDNQVCENIDEFI